MTDNENIESEDEKEGFGWGISILTIVVFIFAISWTMHSCEDETVGYNLAVYNQSSLVQLDLSDYYIQKDLTDSTVMNYLAEIGFYTEEDNTPYPDMLSSFKAKAIDVLIGKIPHGSIEDKRYYTNNYIRNIIRLSGTLLQDTIEQSAFIYKHYVDVEYKTKMNRLEVLDSYLPDEYASKSLSEVYKLISVSDLQYYLKYARYRCATNTCKSVVMYPEKMQHYPNDLLKMLIKKYEDKFSWAELTFTASGAYRDGFEDAIELKNERGQEN